MTRISIGMAITALFIASAVAQQPAPAVRVIRPKDLTWRAVPGYPPGYERAVLEGEMESNGPHTYRVRIPAHFRAKPHTHPSDERVTVLKGRWYLGLGKSFDVEHMQAFEPGSFVIIPAGVPHYVMTGSDETVIQAHGVGPVGITYVARLPSPALRAPSPAMRERDEESARPSVRP